MFAAIRQGKAKTGMAEELIKEGAIPTMAGPVIVHNVGVAGTKVGDVRVAPAVRAD